jgi:hypothetical protein
MPAYGEEHHAQTPEHVPHLPGRTREHRVLAYRVQLEVAEDAELPADVLDE